ncbi:hypothetical protein [Sharpea azabuensis]|uniref:hypothetical protein n=1 Tax=Sharpea azabuensis TaxID=322505 RepID=UPI0015638D0F|nr:hypothetical protein [Sharpea azabuensis]
MKGKTLFIIYQAGRIITAIILSICVIFLFLKTQMLQAINTLGVSVVIFSWLVLEVFCILTLNAYVRNKSMKLSNEEHLAYVTLLSHKVYKRNKKLKTYGLLLMARDELLLGHHGKAQEILHSIVIENLNPNQQKLYYFLQVVLSVLFNQDSHDPLVRYNAIKSKSEQCPDDEEVKKAVEEKQNDELIKMVQGTRVVKHIPSCLTFILGLMIFHFIFFHGLSTQLNTRWILRPRYALYASLIAYLFFVLLSGFVLYKAYQVRKMNHELSTLHKAIHFIISVILMLVVLVVCTYYGVASLFLNDVKERKIANPAQNTYASWKYYEITNDNGYTTTKNYYYSQDGLFFLKANLPVRKSTQNKEMTQSVPSQETQTEPAPTTQNDPIDNKQAILAVYNFIKQDSPLDQMQLEYLYDAKGNIYAQIGQKEDNGKTYSYTLNDNGMKSGQREIVLERQSGSGDAQLVDFYLYDGNKVTDEHKTSW